MIQQFHPYIYTKSTREIVPHKNLYTYVYSYVAHNEWLKTESQMHINHK